MTATLPADKYEDLLRRSGLVDKAALEEFFTQLESADGGKPNDSRILAKKLIDAKLITPWQNDKLMQGRHRGFFLGKYKLLDHISKGGMSEVYLAEQTMMKRQVAIKIFPPDLIEEASYLERFYRESRTQAALDHPNIVKAHDFGQEGKIHYLVMEYVDGSDLHQLVEKKGPLPYKTAAKFIAQGAEALAYAHTQGMVHRDIKPANLMLDRQGSIKLLDLGLARVMEGEGSLTRKHNEKTLGTADYLAPEQAIDSHQVDERADIYSLGGTLYYLLTGHPPFPDGTPVQRMMMHMREEPQSILKERADAPVGLVGICEKMMAKKKEDRYRSAEDVVKALRLWLEKGEGPTPRSMQKTKVPGLTAVTEAPAPIQATIMADDYVPPPEADLPVMVETNPGPDSEDAPAFELSGTGSPARSPGSSRYGRKPARGLPAGTADLGLGLLNGVAAAGAVAAISGSSLPTALGIGAGIGLVFGLLGMFLGPKLRPKPDES